MPTFSNIVSNASRKINTSVTKIVLEQINMVMYHCEPMGFKTLKTDDIK